MSWGEGAGVGFWNSECRTDRAAEADVAQYHRLIVPTRHNRFPVFFSFALNRPNLGFQLLVAVFRYSSYSTVVNVLYPGSSNQP